ncbi:PLP-dependent transferase, partial [Psychrobacter sp. SIMBA_152]
VAEFLVNHPNVSPVHFSGLSDHSAHELATRQHHMKDGYGAIMGFEVKASDSRVTNEAAWHVLDSTQMVSITNNLGDVKT